VSGHVKKAGIYEGPVGLTLREVIYDLGGGMLHDDRPLKGVIPGGSSTPIMRPDEIVQAPDPKHPLHAWNGKPHLDVPMGVDTYRALGSMLGTCGAIVMDTSTNMVEVARNLMRFYAHESCGQCTPCREGTGWLFELCDRLCRGEAKTEEIDVLVDVANNMMGTTICALSDGTAIPMLALVRKYRDEFLAAAKAGTGGVRLDVSTQALVRRPRDSVRAPVSEGSPSP
jgi:NADH-quinone oxidoreductase subunit F